MSGDFSAKLDSILTNPAMMAQIKALADTMTKDSENPASAEANAVPATAKKPVSTPLEKAEAAEKQVPTALSSLLTGNKNLQKNMKNTRALLIALKPYLDRARCEKIDKMLSMLSLAEMAGHFKDLL